MKRFEELITILFILIPLLNLIIGVWVKKKKKQTAPSQSHSESETEADFDFEPVLPVGQQPKQSVKPMERPRMQVRSLMSERKSIIVTEEKKEVITPANPERKNQTDPSGLGNLLKKPEELRRAIILSEIFTRKEV